jgi:hypothetical protein
MSILLFCDNCDQDAFSGVCQGCGNTGAMLLQRDSDDKCAACGEKWYQHGSNGSSGKSASACYIVPGGHFVPLTTTAPTSIPISSIGTTVFAGAVSPRAVFDQTVDHLRSQRVASPTSGMKCTRCKDFNDYAQSNQADGTFLCYTCRPH